MTSQNSTHVIYRPMLRSVEDWRNSGNWSTSPKHLHSRQKKSIVCSCSTRKQDGRLMVQMPVKQEKLQQLGESHSTALSRFYAIERKLQRNPALKIQYVQFMKDYQSLGHMVRVHDNNTTINTQRYYIPHHPVIKDNSLTTKLRVVFDASCKSTGLSLNDCLMVGPTLQQDLFSILLRFRTFKYALTADVTQMFRQVWIHKTQVPLQTILWREDPN